ncbi:MarR family winged helix-turn-helix transcriptional regulator [Humibacter ginsenosidimutans]|uniref:Winged helix DNA-binding protein n=1 Tax=Humibacter ginsenosidimutans TaxID=2599293 RepID=A0A5B8M1T2_9MICO|nr:MarR family transcriptional regulator [Humibacter ginsenosidimutans]QDZ14718.1 winged helix DNA-binding protein [Humibacter ginsenosidimutans]
MTPTVPRMDALESRAWLALVATSELLPAALDAQLRADAQLTHFEFMVLSGLMQAEHATMRSTDIASMVNSTLPRLSKVIGKLAARGLVERAENPKDARVTDVRLTSDGRKVLVHSLPGHLELVHELVIDRLDRQQLAALADILEPLVERLDPARRMLDVAPR